MAAITSMIVAGAVVGGVGMQAYGASQSSKAAKQQAQAAAAVAAQEKIQNELRLKNMQLEASRRQRETIRTNQRARSMSLATATAQGAAGPGSSGLQGAYGQTSGATNNSLLGIEQSLELAQLTAQSNDLISAQRVNQANASSLAATGAGWSSLGGSVVSAAGSMGRLSGGFGSGANYGAAPTSYASPYANPMSGSFSSSQAIW